MGCVASHSSTLMTVHTTIRAPSGSFSGSRCAIEEYASRSDGSMSNPRLARSVRRRAGQLDDLAPLLGFVGDELGVVPRRTGDRRRAQFGKARFELGIGES